MHIYTCVYYRKSAHTLPKHTCLSEERPSGCAEEALTAARLEAEADAWGLKVSGWKCSEPAGMESER